MDQLRRRYEDTYTASVGAFVEEAGEVDATGIPEAHLPLWGKNYGTTGIRAAFVGRDTRGWGDMNAFLDHAKRDVRSAIFRCEAEFLELPFTEWTNNFGTSFWDTVMRYLAAFHGAPDWKALKRRENDEVLHSFVWANSNAVELYGSSAAHNKADFKAWQTLKTAGERHLDSFSPILEVFRPHVAVVMHWQLSEGYWGRPLQWEEIGEYALYAQDAKSGTHVFHTPHPTWLNHQGLRSAVFDSVCKKWESVSKAGMPA